MVRLRLVRQVAAALALLSSAGCTFFAGSGPSSVDVKAVREDSPTLPYALVPLTPAILDGLAGHTRTLAASFPNNRAPGEIRFGIGDVISVTVFEASAGGLFIPNEPGVRPGNFITLPNQSIDSRGFISVPYAGDVRAAGRTPAEVRQEVVAKLGNRAIEPQVVVALVDQRTSLISVLGEVNAPARFPANAAGERILDAITRAGGPKGQGFDTWVMLERGGRRSTVPFGALAYEPRNNVYVHPNDTVYVYREPQTFVAFGASGQQGQFNFEAWRITLAEAVAKAGGLNDSLADPGAVFIYRAEQRDLAKRLGIQVENFQTPLIPVVYHVNFRDPAGYFLATRMEIRNKDLVYTSNAAAVESAKFLQYVRLINATVSDPIVTAANVSVLRNLNRGVASTTTITPVSP